jgi:hypothetical protein
MAARIARRRALPAVALVNYAAHQLCVINAYREAHHRRALPFSPDKPFARGDTILGDGHHRRQHLAAVMVRTGIEGDRAARFHLTVA